MRGTKKWHIKLPTLGLLALLGILFGLSVYTFTYAEGASYFSEDPNACLNCHVMREQFDGWSRNSHQAVATCNDCHTPHAFPDKWVIKGVNGWNHSWAFTTGDFPNTIRIREFNAQIVQENCVQCHEVMVSNIHRDRVEPELTCAACHSNVGHER